MLELFRLVVQDQRVREIYLLQQRIDVVILGNGKGDVGITTQDNRYFVLLAKSENFEVVVVCLDFVAYWIQRTIINFQ